jgi:hypothetical protein
MARGGKEVGDEQQKSQKERISNKKREEKWEGKPHGEKANLGKSKGETRRFWVGMNSAPTDGIKQKEVKKLGHFPIRNEFRKWAVIIEFPPS